MDEATKALLRQRRNYRHAELIRKWRWVIPVCLWLLAFGLLWRFNMSSDFIMESDTLREYEVYTRIIETGVVDIVSNELLNSALMSTALPAYLQRLTHIDPLFLYQYYTLLIFPWLPVLAWFVFRRYVGNIGGALASVMVIAQPHFLWSTSMARVTIALLFTVIAVLLILSKSRWKYPLIGIVGLLIVLSHYGTTFILILSLVGALSIWLTCLLFKHQRSLNYMKPILLLFGVLLVGTFVWHGLIFQRPLGYAKLRIGEIISPRSSYSKVEIPSQTVSPSFDTKAPSTTPVGVPEVGFFNLAARDSVTQVALGATLRTMNLAQRIEFVVSWLVVMVLSYGVLCLIRRGDLRVEARGMVFIAFALCLTGVISPVVSVNYGIARVYYFALLVLAPCFIIGMDSLAPKVKLPPQVISGCLVFFYLLSTTGILHQLVGLHR